MAKFKWLQVVGLMACITAGCWAYEKPAKFTATANAFLLLGYAVKYLDASEEARLQERDRRVSSLQRTRTS